MMTITKALLNGLVGAALGVSLGAAGQTADRPDPGNYGPGPGMMGGWGPGYGMAPGMMSGWSPGYGMGPAMMNRYLGLNLSPQQRSQIARIQRENRKQHWEIMLKLSEEHEKLLELYESDKPDPVGITAGHRKIGELRRHMGEVFVAAQKPIDAVLTRDQREKLRSFDCDLGKWGC